MNASLGVHMAEPNATERYEHCIRHHSRTCTCGIGEDTRQKPLSVEVTREGCMSYAAAEAADGDPDCTTGQPLDMAPRCPECGQPAHSPGDCYVPVAFQDGYIKGAADCAGITAKTDALQARHEALRADVMTVVSDPHLTWAQARKALTAALNK